MSNPEQQRLVQALSKAKHWRRWGPYLAEREWGTVREDYSAEGEAWRYVTHDMAWSYAYRWGEDGIAGLCDNHQRLCFAVALWNGKDPILKERLFGLSNPEGNHGEDVKECYWHLDNTPTHSYMRYLYRYPQAEFPYHALVAENARRGPHEPEFELTDTGVFAESRYFDVEVEYAKADADDVLARIRITNRGPDEAELHAIPTLWFRNEWRWRAGRPRPSIVPADENTVIADHATLGWRYLQASGAPELLFTENDSNNARLFKARNTSLYVKDAFHRYLIRGESEAVARDGGTKCGFLYRFDVPSGQTVEIRFRLHDYSGHAPVDGPEFDSIFDARKREADAFYSETLPRSLSEENQTLARHAFAGLLWSKQWYHYVIEDWLKGDPAMPAPPKVRARGRNADWTHLYNEDVLVMPDTWEYPWYAVWDSAFHAVTLALVDPELAKRQLTLFTREWYMHPNGQLPAYEWNLCDTNPPVHAWAALRVYRMDQAATGKADRVFLESVFHKLLMNFTWWVNRKDPNGSNVFQGGFLGMDNIGVFDRSAPLPMGGYLEQSDGTSWMAMYCLNMLAIAWELSRYNNAYEDIASKFFEHFLYIANAIHNIEGSGESLWDETDGFFYDQLRVPDRTRHPLRIRSMVGLIPLLAVEILDHERIAHMPGFKRRMEWFYDNRPDLTRNITCIFEPGHHGRCLLSLMSLEQLKRLLSVMLDENEFLSRYGIRSLSKIHQAHPFVFEAEGCMSTVRYEPGDSSTDLFGGNSNWRGPIWFPVNFLIVEAMKRYHEFWGNTLEIDCPTGSGRTMTLDAVGGEIASRLSGIFRLNGGRRPIFGDNPTWQHDPAWRDLPLFHEFFHGDTGAGFGASHQTGWTALIANLLVEQIIDDGVPATKTP